MSPFNVGLIGMLYSCMENKVKAREESQTNNDSVLNFVIFYFMLETRLPSPYQHMVCMCVNIMGFGIVNLFAQITVTRLHLSPITTWKGYSISVKKPRKVSSSSMLEFSGYVHSNLYTFIYNWVSIKHLSCYILWYISICMFQLHTWSN